MRLLLVEDDELLGDGLKVGLTQAGYRVEWLKDGRLANHALKAEQFDLVVLDIGLPEMSGIEVLNALRQRDNTTPVLLLTAYDAISDRINGLDAGADDYLVKPFDLDELLARLRAIVRRSTGRAVNLIEYNDITIDPSKHQISKAGTDVSLSQSEYQILHYLLSHTGKVATRQKLEELIHGWDSNSESNSLEVFIHHLRKKFDKDLIRTIRGVGYMVDKLS
ncbi:MAG: response regulator transcription factor [Gammaproteobacteria bacterium]|nr:response regulator transcription factor [Gammaproteobacteria bacterium]